jgi:hypothetical protein
MEVSGQITQWPLYSWEKKTCTYWIQDWVNLRAGRCSGDEENLCPCHDMNPGHPDYNLVITMIEIS